MFRRIERIVPLEVLWAIAPSLSFVDVLGGSALQSRYARLALSSSSQHHVVRSLSIEAISRSMMDAPPQGRVTEILHLLRQVVGSSTDPYLRALVWMSHGYATVSYTHLTLPTNREV